MTTKNIISSGLKSFTTLLKFIGKKIDFDKTEPYKFKAIIDGRKAAFEVAVSQLTKIKQLEESIGMFDNNNQRLRLERLIKSTKTILSEINKVLEMDIHTNESDDDKVKLIVLSKELSFDLLLNITSIRNDFKLKLENNQDLGTGAIRNFASEHVKGK